MLEPRPADDEVRRLVVAYGFAPWNDTSAAVMARRVVADGVRVDVVSQDLSAVASADSGLDGIVAPFVRRRVELPGRPEYGGWAAVRRFVADGLDAVARLELVGNGPYAEVHSRAMWPAAHFLAARYRLLTPAARWTAEFSDPLLHTVAGGLRRRGYGRDDVAEDLWQAVHRADPSLSRPDNVWEMAELLPYAVADTLMFTNPLQRDHMLGYCRSPRLAERARERSVVSPHPTLPPRYYAMSEAVLDREPGTVALGYFGDFYPTRGLAEVWAALRALPDDVRARVRMHVFTGDPEALSERLEGSGLDGVVLPRRALPYLDFLHVATQLDLLVLGDAATAGTHDVNPYLPSKWSDYAGAGTPIWALVEPGSTLSGLPAAYTSRLGDVDDAARVLAAVVARSRP